MQAVAARRMFLKKGPFKTTTKLDQIRTSDDMCLEKMPTQFACLDGLRVAPSTSFQSSRTALDSNVHLEVAVVEGNLSIAAIKHLKLVTSNGNWQS